MPLVCELRCIPYLNMLRILLSASDCEILLTILSHEFLCQLKTLDLMNGVCPVYLTNIT